MRGHGTRVRMFSSTKLAALVLLAMFAPLVVVTPQQASAEPGDTLRHFTADVPACSINTGIAFDGEYLWLSCWGSGQLHAVSPVDGSRVTSVTVDGLSGIGALAWDGIRNQMWACDSSAQAVHLITMGIHEGGDPTQATAEERFIPTGGCIDGLAYDGVNDHLLTSGDVASMVYEWDTAGTQIGSKDISGLIGACRSSGIAVGGGDIFLANNGCSEIYRVANLEGATPEQFAAFPRRIEDLECDDITFSNDPSAPRSAIWAQDAYDAEIYAFELGEGDCGFGGLPAGQFVSVHLGDSYQSGEGAGNHLSDADYPTLAYENGSNYPLQIGAQQDTYSDDFTGGNGCHRALDNYAKINRDRLELAREHVLVDVTCSGARIEPHDPKPAIVGTVGGASWDSSSQVAQSRGRLGLAGFEAEDVDLVTVGMGGNDAEFGEIVLSCVLPSLMKRLVEAYPHPPGDVEFLLNTAGTCRAAQWLLDVNVDQQLADLSSESFWAQNQLLSAFANARVMQLTYPSIVPSHEDVAAWCGGIQRSDIDYLNHLVRRINDAVTTVVSVNDDRYEFLDVGSAFGTNPLCPANDEDALAVGMSAGNVDAEIDRLLDMDGNGDAVARLLLDELVERYRTYRNCVRDWPARGFWCSLSDVTDAWDDLNAHLQANLDRILANVVAPTSPADLALDKATGLFHPSARGFEVLACHVRFAYQMPPTEEDCLANPDQQPPQPRIGGSPFNFNPFLVVPETTEEFEVPGFVSGSTVDVVMHSEPIDLGSFVADVDGTLRVELTIPDAGPGVHRLEFIGSGANDTERVVEARLDLGGEPVPGQSFGVYLCCFTEAFDNPLGPTEIIDVEYLGSSFEAAPDPDGGVLLSVPIPANAGDYRLDVTATSRLTGESTTSTIIEGASVSEWDADVTAPPGANRARAGRTIPVRFTLQDADGSPMEDEGADRIRLYDRHVACEGDPEEGTFVDAEDAGASGLRNVGGGEWAFSWQTQRSWSGTCRDFVVEVDGAPAGFLRFDFR